MQRRRRQSGLPKQKSPALRRDSPESADWFICGRNTLLVALLAGHLALAARILSLIPGTSVEVPAAFALTTGMRRSEILALRWADVDSDLTLQGLRIVWERNR